MYVLMRAGLLGQYYAGMMDEEVTSIMLLLSKNLEVNHWGKG